MIFKKLILSATIFSLLINLSFAQNNLFAGIEIGSKGIKMSVIEINNIRKGDFTVKSYWTENIGISKGIAIDGKLAKEDIDKAGIVVAKNYNKIKDEFQVAVENIYLVGSSGVAMASNTTELIEVIKKAVNKDLEFIDAQTKAKCFLKVVCLQTITKILWF